MPVYQWLTLSTAQQALADRLAESFRTFWSDGELQVWIKESLRTWNSLTEFWNTEFAFTASSASTWYDLSAMAGSPRLRTVVDNDLYIAMEYALLEPPSGGTWTGTSQFQISDLSGALQRRRDEIIQIAGCNVQQLPKIPSIPNTRRTEFPDTTLEPRRARFVPDSGAAVTLSREDTIAFDAFESRHLQTQQFPTAWSVITGPPLSMDVDTAPNRPGNYDVLSLISGPSFNPPASTPVDIPDDWTWLARFGAMADLLGRDSEATDRERAAYCMKRYQDGLKIMKASNWIVSGTINGLPVDLPSVTEMDGWAPEWEQDTAAWPSLVTAGMDLMAVCPLPQAITGVTAMLVGNAPVPQAAGDFVQVSRDVFDVILDYAQMLATFKVGGEEFKATMELEQNFMKAAAETNKRLWQMGIFPDVAHAEGKRQDRVQPR